MPANVFHERLREAREKFFPGRGGLSRLAEKTGIPTGTLSRYENGVNVPSVEACAQIAEAIEESLDRLCDLPVPTGRTVTVEASASAADPTGPIHVHHGADGRYTMPLPQSAHLVKVVGDSMSPVAFHDQFVWVVADAPKEGDLAVIETEDDELFFKRVYPENGTWRCVSVNQDPKYQPISLKKSAIRRIRKVVGTWWG